MSNILSEQYCLSSGIRSDLVILCVVDFSVSDACDKLKDHLLLISYGVVLKCRFDDKKILGNQISGGKYSCSLPLSDDFCDATRTSLIFLTAGDTSRLRFLC